VALSHRLSQGFAKLQPAGTFVRGRILGMAGDRDRRGGGCATGVFVASTLAVLIGLYVLSAGPAYVHLPTNAFSKLYYPLLVLDDRVPPFATVFRWYLQIWSPD
jgi:hypothetical protein